MALPSAWDVKAAIEAHSALMGITPVEKLSDVTLAGLPVSYTQIGGTVEREMLTMGGATRVVRTFDFVVLVADLLGASEIDDEMGKELCAPFMEGGDMDVAGYFMANQFLALEEEPQVDGIGTVTDGGPEVAGVDTDKYAAILFRIPVVTMG